MTFHLKLLILNINVYVDIVRICSVSIYEIFFLSKNHKNIKRIGVIIKTVQFWNFKFQNDWEKNKNQFRIMADVCRRGL